MKTAIGWREWVALPDLGVAYVKAKIDTGARSSSLHAFDLETSATHVRFAVHPVQGDDDTQVRCEVPLVEHREVRSSNGEVEVRPVIRTTLATMGERFEIEMTLTRRDEMGFRMLLGRSALKRRFVIDPGRSFLGGGDRHEPPRELG